MAVVNPPSFMQARADHTAQQDRLMLASLVRNSGVSRQGDLNVTQQSTANMGVTVSAGKCFVVGTENTFQGVYHCYNDGNVNLTIAAASASLPRIDLVIARIFDASFSGSTNVWSLEVVTGTPASTPAAPSVPNNVLKLAQVRVNANASTITNSSITSVVTLARSGLLSSLNSVTSGAKPPSATAGDEIYESDTGRHMMWDGTYWRQQAPSVIGYYDAAWSNAPGLFGNNPQELTNFTVPDPGMPFRVQLSAGCEVGSSATGTRWDAAAGYGGSGNSALGTILTPLYLTGVEAVRFVFATGLMSPVLTGSMVYRVVATRAYGTANGSITAFNRFLRATYFAA